MRLGIPTSHRVHLRVVRGILIKPGSGTTATTETLWEILTSHRVRLHMQGSLTTHRVRLLIKKDTVLMTKRSSSSWELLKHQPPKQREH